MRAVDNALPAGSFPASSYPFGSREGCSWLVDILERMKVGNADYAEIDMLEEITRQIEGHTICALGDAAAWPVQGLIKNFREVMEDRIDDFHAKHPRTNQRLRSNERLSVH